MLRICIFVFVIFLTASVYAIEPSTSNDPAYIESDNLFYDQAKKLVIADGNVRVMQGERVLLADEIEYDQLNNIVKAKGNVSILEPSGDVLFADEANLRDDLKRGVINNFSARLADNSALISRKAEKISDKITLLDHLVYSPCKICKEDRSKSPLWQIKARKVKIDESEEKISYRDAFFEVKSVPVFYTPYFSHATPGAKRKSGFLMPKYRSQRDLGSVVSIPYYWNISEDQDMTITPIVTSNEGVVMSGQYRKLYNSGNIDLEGSITNPNQTDAQGKASGGKSLRGHIEGKGEFVTDENWILGFEGKRVSDDTYLRKYRFGYEDLLTSRIYAEKFNGRNYSSIDSIAFQGLSPGDSSKESPVILPEVNTHFEKKTGVHNSKWTVDANGLVLTRDDGVSTNRASLKGGVISPYVTNNGQLITLSASLRGDGYYVDNIKDSSGHDDDGSVSRVIPEAMLEWSLPLVKNTSNASYYLEPITQLIASPKGNDPDKIPNEDSQDIEFSDERLFNSNHFSGLDRVEGGARTNYGIRLGANDTKYGRVDALLGQHYKVNKEQEFGSTSGIDEHFSDYVGRVSYSSEKFDLTYKFRLDKDNVVHSNKNYVNASLKLDPVTLGVGYISLDANPEETGDAALDRKQMDTSIRVDITDEWAVAARTHRDLEAGQWVRTGSDLIYTGDCASLTFSAYRDFTNYRDLESSTTFAVELSLKGLN